MCAQCDAAERADNAEAEAASGHFRVVYSRKVDGHRTDPRKFATLREALVVASTARETGIDAMVKTVRA